MMTIALFVTACSAEQSNPKPTLNDPYTLPDLIQFNFRWSAEPDIDLFGSPESAIRAYHESYYIASFAHSTAAGYPGYEKATKELVFDPRRVRDINDRTNYSGRPRVGTAYAHLMSINETERGLRALICEGNYSLMIASSDGTFNNYGTRIPTAIFIYLEPGPKGTAPTQPLQEGPGRAPQTDMFGGWTITRHEFSTRNFDDDLACENKFPDSPESRPTRVNDNLTSPYPTLPPYPGWPESSP
ncbi:MAG: hypothetical protein WAX14_15430 [Rhodococcus sp. (in: high G+C Gram-positive bacteria)]|uniref:hypothetical protein n=1 Tax=Rhodococcus sp. TaxID=1831 RepID=UPI003BB53FBF